MPAGVKVGAVTAGDGHTAALTKQGEVYAWGTFKDKNGVLGFSPAVKVQFTPALVYSPAGAETRAVRIASGSDHVLIMLANGNVLSFGCAEIGRLGRMSAADAEVAIRDAPDAQRPALLACALTPTRVPGLPKAVSIAAGWYCSFVVAEGGAVWAFGANNYGQLGFEAKDKEAYAFYAPRRVTALDGRGVSAIFSGEHHTLAVLEGGALLSWGRPTNGGLGRQGVDVNSDDAVHTPQPVAPFGPDNPVVAACAAGRVSACITSQGDMYSWGFNSTCMLGQADEADEQMPYKLRPTRTFPAAGGIAVALGGQHALWLAQPPEDLLVAHERAEKVQRAA